jgi:hypothetical protein
MHIESESKAALRTYKIDSTGHVPVVNVFVEGHVSRSVPSKHVPLTQR